MRKILPVVLFLSAAPAFAQVSGGGGGGTVSADNFNTYVQVVFNYASLRTFTPLTYMVACVLGSVTPNDGGQGHFYYTSSGTYTDNGTTVIVTTGSITGAWLRLTGV